MNLAAPFAVGVARQQQVCKTALRKRQAKRPPTAPDHRKSRT